MMKRNLTCLFVFVVSLFLFTNYVSADYKASAINPAGAKCELSSKSTGYCYYANKNLNSTVPKVVWLDNGDEVTVLTNYDTVDSPNKSRCSDYYVYTSYYSPLTKSTHNGYYCHANLTTGEVSNELKEEFKNAGFPESYWSKLAVLKQAHPKWTFKAINTGLDFSAAVSGENTGNRSLIQGASSMNYALLSLEYGSFDYKNNKFAAYDNVNASESSRWYRANYDAIAYYMDPRNSLIDMYVFQFQNLAYDNKISDTSLRSVIKSAYGSGSLAIYADDFIAAGKQSSVDPIYLAALSIQEVGTNYSTATNGKYNGMYNFYNIGATGGTDPAIRGLEFAANTDAESLRPWNTPNKSIVGGANWMGVKYIKVGQNTSYFKRFNVVEKYLKNNKVSYTPHSNYTHQYQTNTLAPQSEARTTYKSYFDNNLLDLELTFYIPVYSNMPNSTSLPTKGGWPNNYLSSIKINGSTIPGFDGDNTTYNYYLNGNSLKLEAVKVDSRATISGTGTFNINSNCTKSITVKAENGDVRTYKINIILTNTDASTKTVVETLNSAGIKNGTYIYGFNVNTDISVIKQKINNVNSSAVVSLTTYNGTTKNSGAIVTGDKVTIKVGNETKTYSIVLYGDVNGDGKIAATDYVKIKNHIMGKITLSGAYKEAADVDRNGTVKATDYVKIKNYIMGKGSITQ